MSVCEWCLLCETLIGRSILLDHMRIFKFYKRGMGRNILGKYVAQKVVEHLIGQVVIVV